MPISNSEILKKFLADELISIEINLNHLVDILGANRQECLSACKAHITKDKEAPKAILGFCFTCLENLRQAVICTNSAIALEMYGKLKYFHGWAVGSIESTDYKSQKMSEYATLAHAKTYQKQEMITEYWRQNVPPKTSNEKAAELLLVHFPEVSHRTLANYVAKAKKASKLPRAS